jgi:hypothetical protein
LSAWEGSAGSRYITEETLDQYLRYVTRWKKAGRALPQEWFLSLTLEFQHTARCARLGYHPETVARRLVEDLPDVVDHLRRTTADVEGEPWGGNLPADPCHVF